MKTLFCIFSFLSINSNASALYGDSIVKISYLVSHQLDSTDKNSVVSFPMILYIAKNSSRFVSPNKLYNDSVAKEGKGISIIKDGTTMTVKRVGNTKKTLVAEEYYEYIKNYSSNKNIILGSIAMQQYQIVDILPTIQWELEGQTKIIAGVKCQKAKANYKGRKWLVWYAPSSFYSNGPWKLGGLPGLILYAADEKEQIIFSIENFQKEKYDKQIIFPSNTTPIVTKEEFNRNLALYNKNRQAYIADTYGIKAESVTSNFKLNEIKKQVINNPIELPEKQ